MENRPSAAGPRTPIVFLILILFAGSAARAQEPSKTAAGADGRFGVGANPLHLVWVDARDVLGAPLQWRGPEWRDFSLAVAGVGAAALLDKTVRDAEARDHSRFADRVANAFEPLGSTEGWEVVGLFYLGGVLADDQRARSTAFDAVLSTAIADGVYTSALKPLVRRRRPRETSKTFDFGGGSQSFPSGHATHAFAIASVVAAHYDSYWIKGVSYGSAAIVAFARIHHQAHFLSDVTAGGLIGTAVGRSVVHHNQAERSRLTFVPIVGPKEQPGMAVAFSF